MISSDISQLSKNEQLVLHQLVQNPGLTDRQVYTEMGMKQSTYSTIKKKLSREGFFYTSYVPVLQHLGCELLVVWYLTLNRKTRTEDRLALTRDQLLGYSEMFSIVSESNQAVCLSISRNIADHIKISDALIQLYEYYDFLEEIKYVLFPFEVSSLFSFFDFAPLLNRCFHPEETGMKYAVGNYQEKNVCCKVRHSELTALEKRVLLGLVRYPELSDSLLSDKVGCSRQILARIKNRLIQDELVTKKRIISMEKLGFNILALTHSKFNPLEPVNARLKCLRYMSTIRTPILHVARDPECVMLTAYRDFQEFKKLHNEYVSFCAKKDILKGEPVTRLLSIPRIFEVKWLVFEPLTRRILKDI